MRKVSDSGDEMSVFALGSTEESNPLAYLDQRVRLRVECFDDDSCKKLANCIKTGGSFSSEIYELISKVFHEEAPLFVANDVYALMIGWFKSKEPSETQEGVKKMVGNLGSSGIKILALSGIECYIT